MSASDLLQLVRDYAVPGGLSREFGSAWFRQQGEIRLGQDKPWMPFAAEQWFPGAGIDFRWCATARMFGLVPIRVVDAFERGEGVLSARLLGVIPVASARGPQTDIGEAIRGLAELPWRPFGFREGPPFRWEIAGIGELQCTFDDGRTRATVLFDVAPDGRIRACSVPRRPRLVGRSTIETPWSGVFDDYREFHGVRIPTRAEVSWHPPEGSFAYWRSRITDYRATGT